MRACLKRSLRLSYSNSTIKNSRFLAVESKGYYNKPKSLDDVYTNVGSSSTSPRAGNDMFYASTSYDQVLTRVDSEILQTWSLYEACLEGRDYERADLMLQNIATKHSGYGSYFLDAISEFLKTWGAEDVNTMEDVRRWLTYVCSLDRNFTPDARIYAWMIKLSFGKTNDVKEANDLLIEYTNLSPSNKNADVLRYVDIIGLLNIKKLVDYKPKLAEDLAGNYRDLFLALSEEQKDLDSPSSEPAVNNPISLTDNAKNLDEKLIRIPKRCKIVS